MRCLSVPANMRAGTGTNEQRELRYKYSLPHRYQDRTGQDRTGGLQNRRRLTGHDVGYDIRIEKGTGGF